ncbi:MAG: ubiquinol-cytochrome c reductase iron-sulfur subunit [Pseudonocardia sp.]
MTPDETSTTPDETSTGCGIGRRALVAGAGSAGLTVLGAALAGCAADSGPTRGAPSSDGRPVPGGLGSAPGIAAAPGPPPDPGAGGGGSGTRLGAAADLPVGGGAVFGAWEVVVTRPSADEYRGFTAVCTHTGCTVARVAGGLIECPCHGSRFRLDGSVSVGPAPRALAERPVVVVDGQILLS